MPRNRQRNVADNFLFVAGVAGYSMIGLYSKGIIATNPILQYSLYAAAGLGTPQIVAVSTRAIIATTASISPATAESMQRGADTVSDYIDGAIDAVSNRVVGAFSFIKNICRLRRNRAETAVAPEPEVKAESEVETNLAIDTSEHSNRSVIDIDDVHTPLTDSVRSRRQNPESSPQKSVVKHVRFQFPEEQRK